MATRRPLVLVGGRQKELPIGDGIDAAFLGGYAIGTSGNTVPLNSGANTWSAQQIFNTSPLLKATTADEGGEIFFEKPSNSTLVGTHVVNDLAVNSIRLFESGGSNRGVYVDLTGAAAGANSALLHAGNYNNYSPTLTGTGASGSWNINAASVTNGVYTIGPQNIGGVKTFTNSTVFSAEVQSTFSNSYRHVQGNYASFWHQNGADLYLMLTNSGDQYGSFNGLRPFAVNLASGYVSMYNGLSVFQAGDSLVRSTGQAGYGSFSATSSGTNNAYVFFHNGGGANERGRITVQNDDTMLFGTGASSTTHLSLAPAGATFFTNVVIASTGASERDLFWATSGTNRFYDFVNGPGDTRGLAWCNNAGGYAGSVWSASRATGDMTINRLYVGTALSVGTNFNAVGTIVASNFSGSSSGTNTGDQTSVSGNAGTVTDGMYLSGQQFASGQKIFEANQNIGTMLNVTGGLGGIECKSSGAGNAAFMSFHIPGTFATYVGIDIDNQFTVGGWSNGAAVGSAKFKSLGIGVGASGTVGQISCNDVVATGFIYAGQNFISTTAATVIATTGAGVVYLRPNGSGSSVGEFYVNSLGQTNTSGNRFFANFSASAGDAARFYIQSSTANAVTNVSAIPNGTSNDALFTAFSTSDPANSHNIQIKASATGAAISTNALGTGTLRDIDFLFATVMKAKITTVGEIISTSSNAFRMIGGNYGAFWRNDGASVYLLSTASADQYGTWNSNRPFNYNLANGNVTINRVTMSNTAVEGLSIADGGGSGANLALFGNGATTPNKYIRAISGNLEFVNSAYNAVIATMGDTGNFAARDGIFGRGDGTGVVYFGTTGTDRYLYYDGTKYILNVATLFVEGLEVGHKDIPGTTAGLVRGKRYIVSAGFTLNTGTTDATYSVYNDSGAAITITQGSGLTLRHDGTATTGNFSVPQRGTAFIWFKSATEAVVS